MAAEGEEKEKMVMLRSEDGVDFVLSEAEAEAEALFGRKIRIMMKYESEKHVIPSDDGGEIRYCLIRLSVRGDTLSKVMDYSRTHASGSHDLSDWDADFIAGFNHEALFDLILASEYLQIRGLIDLACQTVASKIKGKSPREICNIFNIKSVFAPELDGDTIAKRLQDSTTCSSDKELPCSETPCLMQELEWEEKALQALDIVRCQEFTGYDPKVNAYIRTRFDIFNLAFFDLDKQSDFCRGPRLNMIPTPTRNSIVGSCVNVITLKVKESEVGFPIKVFGTVVARDQVDYRCVYLFRRERDDPQLITSVDGDLTLMDPCRALVPADRIYFEINLMIVRDGGEVKDFSKGVIVFNRARLPNDKLTMSVSLNSYLSRVEVRCAYVVYPTEATIEVNILKGPCSVSRVVAATTKNYAFPQPPQQKYPEQPQQPFPWQQPTIQLYLQQQLNPCKEFLLQQCRPVSLLSYLWSKILQQSSCRVMQQQCCLQLAQIPEQYKCTAIDSIVHAIFMQQGQRQGVQIVQQQPQPQQVGQCVLVQGQGVVQPQQLAQMEAIRTLVLQSVPSMCNFNVPPNCSTIKAPFVGVVTGVGGQ